MSESESRSASFSIPVVETESERERETKTAWYETATPLQQRRQLQQHPSARRGINNDEDEVSHENIAFVWGDGFVCVGGWVGESG